MSASSTQILTAFKAALLGSTSAGARVFVNRPDPLAVAELPALLITESDAGESIEPYFLDGTQKRELDIELRCIVGGDLNASDAASALALEVEVLVAASPALAALCPLGLDIVRSAPALSGDVTQVCAERQQTWRVAYTTSRANPALVNP